MAGQRGAGSRLPWQTQRGGSGREEGPRRQGDRHQKPPQTQPSEHHLIQVTFVS